MGSRKPTTEVEIAAWDKLQAIFKLLAGIFGDKNGMVS